MTRSIDRPKAERAAPAQRADDSPPVAVARDRTEPKPWRNRVTLAAMIAAVALVTAAVNLAFLVRPSLKRDPGVENAAEIAILTMDRNVRYADYRRRPGAVRPQREPQTKEFGNVFYLQSQMHGFKGRQARLRWFTYDAENGDRLSRPYSSGTKFRAKAPSNKSISVEWVQLPLNGGTYMIRFELYDGDDVLLAFADSQKFTTRTLPVSDR